MVEFWKRYGTNLARIMAVFWQGSRELNVVSTKDMAEFYKKIWCSFNKDFRGVLARKNRT